MPHKCIQVSEEGFLDSIYTKTGRCLLLLFVACPTKHANVAQGLFLVCPHAPSMAKNTFGPISIPLIRGCLRHHAITPLKGVKAWGDSPLKPEEISSYRDTLGQIRATAKHGWLKCDLTTGRSAVLIQLLRYLLQAPPNGQVWHKAFF